MAKKQHPNVSGVNITTVSIVALVAIATFLAIIFVQPAKLSSTNYLCTMDDQLAEGSKCNTAGRENFVGQGIAISRTGSKNTLSSGSSKSLFSGVVAEVARRPSREAVANAIVAAAVGTSEMNGRNLAVQSQPLSIVGDFGHYGPCQSFFTVAKKIHAVTGDSSKNPLPAETLSIWNAVNNLQAAYPEISVKSVTSKGNDYIVASYGSYEVTFEGKPTLSSCEDSDRAAVEGAGGAYLPISGGQYFQPGVAYSIDGSASPDLCFNQYIIQESYCGNGATAPSYAANFHCDNLVRPDGTKMECIKVGPSAKCG